MKNSKNISTKVTIVIALFAALIAWPLLDSMLDKNSIVARNFTLFFLTTCIFFYSFSYWFSATLFPVKFKYLRYLEMVGDAFFLSSLTNPVLYLLILLSIVVIQRISDIPKDYTYIAVYAAAIISSIISIYMFFSKISIRKQYHLKEFSDLEKMLRIKPKGNNVSNGEYLFKFVNAIENFLRAKYPYLVEINSLSSLSDFAYADGIIDKEDSKYIKELDIFRKSFVRLKVERNSCLTVSDKIIYSYIQKAIKLVEKFRDLVE